MQLMCNLQNVPALLVAATTIFAQTQIDSVLAQAGKNETDIQRCQNAHGTFEKDNTRWRAALVLARCYSGAAAWQTDRQKMQKYLDVGLKSNHWAAHMQVALLFLQTLQDAEKARDIFLKLIARPRLPKFIKAHAEYQLGIYLANKPNAKTVELRDARFYLDGAVRAKTYYSIEAAQQLAILLRHGRGGAKDELRATEILKQALDLAKNKNGFTERDFGIAMLSSKYTTDEGEKILIELCHRRNDQIASRMACHNLASMYYFGESGRTVDYKKAKVFALSSIHNKCVERQSEAICTGLELETMEYFLDIILLQDTKSRTNTDAKLAKRYINALKTSGEADAFAYEAIAYDDGIGFPTSSANAAKSLLRAVTLGSAFVKRQFNSGLEGWSEDTVRSFQRLLIKEGAYNGKVDGDFGSNSQSAVAQIFGLQRN